MSLLHNGLLRRNLIMLNVIARVATVRGVRYTKEEVSPTPIKNLLRLLNRCQAENARMTCQRCGFISCFSCTAPWHEGLTCREYHNLFSTDHEAEEHKRRYCKRCPGAGCGEYTMKIGACHEMSCPSSKSCILIRIPKFHLILISHLQSDALGIGVGIAR